MLIDEFMLDRSPRRSTPAEQPDDDAFRFPPDTRQLTGVCASGDHHMCGGKLLGSSCGCEGRCKCRCHKL